MPEVDLTPLVQLLVALLALVGSWALWRLGKRFGFELDDKARDLVSSVIERAVMAAVQKHGQATMDGKLMFKASIESDIVRVAVEYLTRAIPDTLKRFGIDPGTEDGKRRLRDMVQARLPGIAVKT